MGDRSNIVIESTYGSETNRVYLYSHWDGENVIKSAVHGLSTGRATDNQYLARIIFDNMVGTDQGTETGYGISADIGDNEHPILVITDAEGTQVYFEQAWSGKPSTALTRKVPYTEFLAIVKGIEDWEKKAQLNELYKPLIALMK